MSSKEDNPKVFISYSWSSSQHEAFVMELAEKLMADGVQVILDKWDLREGHDKYVFMETMVTDPEVNKVLIISDQAYAHKADQRAGGVGTESQIISGEVYNQVNQEKFIPIVTEYANQQPCLPSFLKTRIYIDLATAGRFDEEYEKLLRNIHQLPKIVKPPIGKIPDHLLNNTAKPVVKRSAQSKQSTPVKYSGRDQYGFYDEFTYQHVIQRMRWIEAGTFQMGAPEHELERGDDEILHTVTLTDDFWLADTACTQALWQAVMGNNPSRSNPGGLYPVETVSWNDVDLFIKRLNAQLPDWNLRLPTEAEWEYACRAGSQSPFSFGETISTEQANYNGNFPYADGKQGQYREKTVEVTALEQNNWGLYQMHGNVWEWCSDWYDDYSTETLTNPVGSTTGRIRVLRGGGWLSTGRNLRSAGRDANQPDYRFRIYGFRLAGGRPSGA